MFVHPLLKSAIIGSALALSIAFVFSSPLYAAEDSAAQAPTFSIQDLGMLPFIADDVSPAINDAGVVAFWQYNSLAVGSTVWSQGKVQVLGSTPDYFSSMAHAINAEGEVVGWTSTSINIVDSRAVTRACVWRKNTLTLLGTLGGQTSQAFGISTKHIVGVSQCADGTRHAFITQGSQLHDLGTLPGGTFSQAYAINATGWTVGVSNSTLPYKHAVCWHDGKIQDLGLLPGGTTSSAQAINHRGQIAGYADTPEGTHAFLYTDGKMQDLGTLGADPSRAEALNDQGQVVGLAGYADDQHHAFFWQNGQMYDLNKLTVAGSPWILLQASAINNHTQIVCQGHRKGEPAHILLLTPVLASTN